MALFKVSERHSSQSGLVPEVEIIGLSVYARLQNQEVERIGSVDAVLINEAGQIRYLVIDTGFWIFGKKVLLPIGRCVDDPEQNRIYALGLQKEQVQNLPAYSDDQVIDADYEEQVQTIYKMSAADNSVAVESSSAVEQLGVKGYATSPLSPTRSPAIGTEDQDDKLYTMNEEHHRLKLYEERLVANKRREKTGEVTVTKRIETEQTEASVPIQKEKIVIEIESAPGATRVNTSTGSLQVGDNAHIDLHEERVDFSKEPTVHHEVTIRKESETDIVTAHETLRREELEVEIQGDASITERDV